MGGWLQFHVPRSSWGGDSLGEGASMMEPEMVKNRGLSRVSGGIVVDDVIHSDPWVRWTDLEILHNFPSGLNKKGARGKAEMSIFAFFCAQRRQHRPPLRGGRLR